MTARVDHPGGRPDGTRRRLEYLPAAVIGNGALLVTLSARGEVERMLWPHVDGPGHIAELRLGVPVEGEEVAWLDEHGSDWTQEWLDEGASVLVTRVETEAGTGACFIARSSATQRSTTSSTASLAQPA